MAIEYGGGSSFSVELEGPFGAVGSSVKLTAFTAPALNWKGAVSPYTQTVAVEGVSVNSKVDLQLDTQVLHKLSSGSFAFTAENDGGEVTLYALGDKPSEDLIFQATVTEVTA